VIEEATSWHVHREARELFIKMFPVSVDLTGSWVWDDEGLLGDEVIEWLDEHIDPGVNGYRTVGLAAPSAHGNEIGFAYEEDVVHFKIRWV
jgi:hypothetical protein